MCLNGSQNNFTNYSRHKPEQTLLYKTVQENLLTFLDQAQANGSNFPNFIKEDFLKYLDCGILAKGFIRVHCDECKHDRTVAFSCKRRSWCPSCGGKRLTETAAHLTDSVFPEVQIRQWVISFPMQIRFFMAHNPKLTTKILDIYIRIISNFYSKRVKKVFNIEKPQTGSVTLIQRFNSALCLSPHYHALFIDGAYDTSLETPKFYRLAQPTMEELEVLVNRIKSRVTRMLVKEGFLGEGQDYNQLEFNQSLLGEVTTASVTYRNFFDKAKITTLKQQGEKLTENVYPGCAMIDGFSLHAKTSVLRRDKLEKLCRYIARPPVAVNRLTKNSDGLLVYQLKRQWSDGTTHVYYEPLELLARLAALIPPPKANLIRFHGILAANAKARSKVIPNPKVQKDKKNKKFNLTWAQAMQRAFLIDVLKCPVCKNQMRVLSVITETFVIKKILTHLNLDSDPPPISPSRQVFSEFETPTVDIDYID